MICLGLMGTVMLECLHEHGFHVLVWNRTKEKADPRIALGGDYSRVGSVCAIVYIFGLVVIWFAPDTSQASKRL
jgi:3-hydroxyisobutyrate dehydrogenase-like beta-hydroxyacid dehydrogenase